MTEKRKSSEPMLGIDLDFYTIGKDVFHEGKVWLIVDIEKNLHAF